MSPAAPGAARGELVELCPGVRRVLAPNPSLLTGPGTNSYLVGDDDLVAIDPGPLAESHLDALARLTDGRLRYVLLTHRHADHAAAAAALARRTGAAILSCRELPDAGPVGELADGDVVRVGRFRLEAIATPGHASDHLCFLLEATPEVPRTLFTGDHVLGGTSVAVIPPDGDMGAYLQSLRRLATLAPPPALLAPGHGPPARDAPGTIAAYLEHRLARERAVLEALAARPGRAADLVEPVYGSLPAGLVPAATATVWAHLRKLGAEGRARSGAPDDPDGRWWAVSSPSA